MFALDTPCTAFEGHRRIAAGPLGEVALAAKHALDAGAQQLRPLPVLVLQPFITIALHKNICYGFAMHDARHLFNISCKNSFSSCVVGMCDHTVLSFFILCIPP